MVEPQRMDLGNADIGGDTARDGRGRKVQTGAMGYSMDAAYYCIRRARAWQISPMRWLLSAALGWLHLCRRTQ
ncbi:hypothetical protein BO71DRAFT_123084 [Aspergillus ellipticus CBS 707.79]|uniref:Uncharacterized protein n=1 Tax=Aspergillus ellipticus CBS 707.79 TaxID=1448320 RepID=A0A319CVS8_9EURO|nr:hypothetical protein BO71DRAFT_123084 [Aspergillus ellipticus CBS 707.79]